MANDVFISYSRNDKTFTQRLFDELQDRGRSSWVDWHGIPLTSDWWNEIREGIESADTFLFIMSEHSLKSPVCSLEVAHAIANNKRIIPVMIEEQPNEAAYFTAIALYKPDAAMEERLEGRDLLVITRDNWKILSKLNWVWMRPTDRFESAFANLLTALDIDLDYVKQHTSLLVDARQWSQNNQEDSYLLRGDNLVHAEEWLASSGSKEPKPTQLQTNYIVASRTAETARQQRDLQLQRRAANRLRYLGGSIVVFLIIGLALLSFALVNAQAAQVAAAQSEGANIAASALLQNDVSQSELTALLSIRSLRANYSVQAETTLSRALENLSTIRVFGPNEQRVRTAAFSPDGQYVLTGSYDEYLRLWDVETAALIWETQLPQAVLSAAFSPDGRFIVAGCYSYDVVVLEAARGTITQTFATSNLSYDYMNLSAAWSPTATIVAIGNSEGTIQFWNPQTGEFIGELTGHRDFVSGLIYSSDGTRLFSSSGDRTIRVWDAITSEELQRFSGHTAEVMSIALSPDEQTLLSGSADETIRLWDVGTATEIRQFSGQVNTVRSVAFSPDGRLVAAGGLDNTGRVWDASNGELQRTLVGHGEALDIQPGDRRDTDATSAIFAVAFSQDSQFVITGGWDGAARLWSLQERRFDAHNSAVMTVAFSPDSRTLLTGGEDSTVRLWDVTTRQQIREYVGNQYSVFDVGFSDDGRYVFSAGQDGAVRVWVTETGQVQSYFPIEDWDANLSPTMYGADISADGRHVIAGDEYGTVYVWDMLASRFVDSIDFGRGFSALYEVHYSPDESYLLVASQQEALAKVWSFGTNAEERWFTSSPPSRVLSAAYSPDGAYVVIGSADSTARLFNVAEYRQEQVYDGHTGSVVSATFSPDGQFVLTGSADNTARLWDRASGREIRQLVGHSNQVNDVAYSPDGRWIATASLDGTFRLWDANVQDFLTYACSHLFRDLTENERSIFSLPETATCPQFGMIMNTAATWTPIPTQPVTVVAALPTIMPTATPNRYQDQYNFPAPIYDLEYSPDGAALFYYTSFGPEASEQIYMLDAETLDVIRIFEGDFVRDIEITSDSTTLVASQLGYATRTWNIRNGLPGVNFGPESTELEIATTADNRVVSLSYGNELMFWDGNGEDFDTIAVLDEGSRLRRVEFAPDGEVAVLVAESSPVLTVWNVVNQRTINSFTVPGIEGLNTAGFSGDGSLLYGFNLYSGAIWNWRENRLVRSFDALPPLSQIGYGFETILSPDGKYVFVGGGLQAYLIDVETGSTESISVMGSRSGSAISSAAFSPNSRSLVIGDSGGTITRWNIQ